jgi:hypothetical protein
MIKIERSNSTYGKWCFKVGEKFYYYYFRKKEAQIALARMLKKG